MKKLFYFFSILALTASCFPYGGNDGDILRESQYEPITVIRVDFENRVTLEAPKPIVNAGKIYVKDDFLFINEKEMGVHIYDNANPSSPVPKAYINIDGNTDIAVKETVIYAHHATDLIAIEYNPRLNSIQLRHRETNVFPVPNSPDGYSASFFNVPDDQVIIGYRLK